ncbi:unnamed protein product, partial [Heterosigma akashiwo]
VLPPRGREAAHVQRRGRRAGRHLQGARDGPGAGGGGHRGHRDPGQRRVRPDGPRQQGDHAVQRGDGERGPDRGRGGPLGRAGRQVAERARHVHHGPLQAVSAVPAQPGLLQHAAQPGGRAGLRRDGHPGRCGGAEPRLRLHPPGAHRPVHHQYGGAPAVVHLPAAGRVLPPRGLRAQRPGARLKRTKRG